MGPPTSTWDHCLEHVAVSDIGMRRANNQDALAVALADGPLGWSQRGHLFLVADGMGAHAAGELASKLAADSIPLGYLKHTNLPPPQALLQSVHEANDVIHRRSLTSDDFRGMGTTSTALVLAPQGAIVAHIGDSRAYRLRGQRLDQLTFDHSLQWEMREAARGGSEQLAMCVPKNIITRSLGPNETTQVDLEGPFPLQIGDTFLLCSDGLSGQVKDSELATILYYLPPSKAARLLVDLANLRGGPDNITLIIARVTGPQVARDAGAESMPGRSPGASQPVSPLAWALLGVFGLAALLMLVVGYPIAAVASLLVGLIAATVAWVQGQRPREAPFTSESVPVGRGPYASCDVAADPEFVDRLAETVGQLRDAAVQEHWAVQWEVFNRLQTQGAQAKQRGDFPQAVKDYCEAITFMMDQLRSQGPRR